MNDEHLFPEHLVETGVVPYERIKDDWNAMAKAHGHRTVKLLDTARREKLRIRWQEPEFRLNWPRLLELIPKIPFLHGKNDRGWKATFDFLIRNKSKYRRILAGEYGEPVEADPALSPEDQARQADAMAVYKHEKEQDR